MRVLETGQDAEGRLDLSLLDQLRVMSVDALRVQYTVKAFNHEISSDPEDLPAKFQAADGVLYIVRRGGEAPWPSIARELALALCPDTDPGQLAAGVKDVLAAPSESAAAAILDELGFAPLAVAEVAPTVSVGVIEDLGGASTPTDPQQAGLITDVPPPATGSYPGAAAQPRAEGSTQPTSQGETGAPAAPASGEPPTTGDVTSRRLGPVGGPPAQLPPGLEDQPRSLTERARFRKGTPGEGEQQDRQQHPQPRSGERDSERRPSRGGYPVLRSYVAPQNPDVDGEADPAVAERRELVNRHGMVRVLDYERLKNRHPREMPHSHPGYDVESDNAASQIERFIEVKSLSGDWEGPYAGMSDTQFKKNEELGSRYWLYVVERADQPDFKIWRIHNPAQRVTNFMFDDGWKGIAEADDEDVTEPAAAEETT